MADIKKRKRGQPPKEAAVKPKPARKSVELGPDGTPIKRKRGRPRKNPLPSEAEATADTSVQASNSPTEPAAKRPCDHPEPVSEEAIMDTKGSDAPSIPNLILEESEDWVIVSTPVQ